jgi:membrane protein
MTVPSPPAAPSRPAPAPAGDEAPAPARRIDHLGQLVEHAVREYFRDGCGQRAAAISFYTLFSLFPLAILSVAVLGLVLDDAQARHRVISLVLDNLPLDQRQGRAELQKLLWQVTRSVAGFGILGLITLLFAASGVMSSIRLALNAAFDARDTRPPAQAKLFDILGVFGFGVFVTLSFALTLVDQFAGKLGDQVTTTIASLGRLLPLAVAVCVFAVLFRVVPANRPRLRDTWPGVLVAAVGYELAKTGFAIYLGHFAHYGAVYASLGSIIALLVFVYVAASVALLGAEIASEWPCVRAGDYDGGPSEPLLRRLAGFVRGLFLR